MTTLSSLLKQTGALGLLLALAGSGAAQADSFDPATNQLTIDSVLVNGVNYKAVVTIANVISVSPVATAPAAQCAAANFTTAIYNAIKPGMTVDQVNATIGCQFTPSLTVRSTGTIQNQWFVSSPTAGTKFILVFFDSTTLLSTRTGSGGF